MSESSHSSVINMAGKRTLPAMVMHIIFGYVVIMLWHTAFILENNVVTENSRDKHILVLSGSLGKQEHFTFLAVEQ